MSDWREGFHTALGAYIQRYVEHARPHGDWGQFASIIDVTETIDKGFGSDVTAGDDPEIELSVTWLNTAGQRHSVSLDTTLAQLMKELDR